MSKAIQKGDTVHTPEGCGTVFQVQAVGHPKGPRKFFYGVRVGLNKFKFPGAEVSFRARLVVDNTK